MSNYTITHSCGCNQDHNITGTNVNGERERKADWLASQPCTACQRTAATVAAKTANARLPALTGSDKQIAWAETIRAKIVAQSNALPGWTLNRSKVTAAKLVELDALLAAATRAKAQTAAGWWIVHRADSLLSIIKSCK